MAVSLHGNKQIDSLQVMQVNYLIYIILCDTALSKVCSNIDADIYLFADDAKLCRHIAHESDYEIL